jgi:exodeoxyribonuclease VIII
VSFGKYTRINLTRKYVCNKKYRYLRRMNNTTYHNDITHVSKSGLDLIAECPALFKHRKLDGNRPQDDDASLHVGSYVHDFVLDPAEYWANVASGKYSPETTQHAQEIKRALQNHPTANRLLFSEGSSEVMRAFDYNGVRCKVKADRLPRSIDVIADLKTAKSANAKQFRSSVLRYRYHVQRAMYLAGFRERSEMVFVVVETVAPYRVECYTLPPDIREEGQRLFERDLETYRRCMETGTWPNYTNAGVVEL